MAASYTWAAGLPQSPVSGSFSESFGYNYLVSPMVAGAAKIRKRSNKANQMAMTFIMSTSQVEQLEAFVEVIGGVSRFYFPHPRTGDDVEVRIVPSSEGGLYTISESAIGYWNVAMTLEQMP